jgi:hypothetical protein
MFLFDLWSMHSDVRQAIYALDGDGYSATFFDNSHLFGGPHWSLANPAQPAGTIERAGLGALHRSDWTAEWIWRFRKMLPQALREAVRQTPAHWHGGDVEALQLRLRARLAAMESIVEETALRTSLGAV